MSILVENMNKSLNNQVVDYPNANFGALAMYRNLPTNKGAVLAMDRSSNSVNGSVALIFLGQNMTKT